MEADVGLTGRHAAGLFAGAAVHRDDNGHALHAPVLVLNASYEPINVCAARRALVLVLKGVAMTEEAVSYTHLDVYKRQTWSSVRSLEGSTVAQYWQVLRSRKRIFLRDKARLW